MSFLKVENAEGLVRDTTTGAILNNDISGYQAYMKQKERSRKQKEQIAEQEKQINNIKNELSDIKQLLLSLIEKNGSKG